MYLRNVNKVKPLPNFTPEEMIMQWVFFLLPSWNKMYWSLHVTLSEILLFIGCHSFLFAAKKWQYDLFLIYLILQFSLQKFVHIDVEVFLTKCPQFSLSPNWFILFCLEIQLGTFLSFAGFKNFGDVQHLEMFCTVGLCVMRFKFSK